MTITAPSALWLGTLPVTPNNRNQLATWMSEVTTVCNAVTDDGLGLAQIDFPSSVTGSPWTLDTDNSATFLGQVNPVMKWGYNVSDGGVRLNTADANIWWQLESNYKEADRSSVETNLSMTATDGTYRRLFIVQVDRDDPDDFCAASLAISADRAFNLIRVSNGTALFTFTGGGTLVFSADGAQMQFGGALPHRLQSTAAQPFRFTTNAKDVWMSEAVDGLEFGSARDTNLYRSAASTLKTDDALIVGGALTVTTSTYADNAAADSGGLAVGSVYKTATGELRVVV